MARALIPPPDRVLVEGGGRINLEWYEFFLVLLETMGLGEDGFEDSKADMPVSAPAAVTGPTSPVSAPVAPDGAAGALIAGALGRIRSIEQRLQLLEDLIHDTVQVWRKPISEIPDGWQLADGTNGTDDLRNLFIIGADADSGGTYDVGDTSATGSAPSSTVDVQSGSGTTVAADVHTHVPQHYALAFIQKVNT